MTVYLMDAAGNEVAIPIPGARTEQSACRAALSEAVLRYGDKGWIARIVLDF